MIVVDSSVWIDHLRDRLSPQVAAFRSIEPDSIVAGDLIVLEVLRGLSSEAEAVTLARKFEAVANEIGEVLDLRLLVIMREDHRIAVALEALNLGKEVEPFETGIVKRHL